MAIDNEQERAMTATVWSVRLIHFGDMASSKPLRPRSGHGKPLPKMKAVKKSTKNRKPNP